MSACPTPHKSRHWTVERARLHAIYVALRKGNTLYGYRCDCKAWHVTRRATWNGQKHLLLARRHAATVKHSEHALVLGKDD